jgi:hypothetical protein
MFTAGELSVDGILSSRQQIDDSGWVSSGAGANFSDWYRVCSKPAPDGFRVASSTFRLEGDRLCNAFSECQEDPRTDKQVCWRFRLERHSESIFQNQGRAMSRGILQTTLEPVQTGEGQGNRYGVVYIQFSGEENRQLAEQLREELVKSGYRSSGVQRIDFEFTGGVKYFNDADAKNAAELAGFVNSFLKAHSSHPLQMSPVRAASEASVPAGQMEVWLALKPVPEIQSHVEPTQKVTKYAQRPGCECGPNTIDVSPSSLEGKIGEELGFTYDASYLLGISDYIRDPRSRVSALALPLRDSAWPSACSADSSSPSALRHLPVSAPRFRLAPRLRLAVILCCSWLSLPIWPPVETSRLGDISMVVTSPKGGTLLIWSELSISKFILNLALVLVLKFHGFVCVAKVERVAIE